MDVFDVRPKMDKVIEILKGEISQIRTGRATPSLVENIPCLVYGGTHTLKVVELGTISTPDSRTIVIHPFDPSIIGEIRQGIEKANIGLTPIVDGEVIRIQVPPLSGERRQELVKLLHQQIEAGRVMIRQIRRDKMIDIRRAAESKELNEDEKFRLEEDLQKITDEYVEKIESLGKEKEKELLSM